MQLLSVNSGGKLRQYRSHLDDQVKEAQMKKYKPRTSEKRYQIFWLKRKGVDQSAPPFQQYNEFIADIVPEVVVDESRNESVLIPAARLGRVPAAIQRNGLESLTV